MDIRLNGEPHKAAASTLVELLAEQRIDPASPGVAVAVNWSVVPRSAWATTGLADGDDVEIVRPHAGG